jgi:hypothetical protein
LRQPGTRPSPASTCDACADHGELARALSFRRHDRSIPADWPGPAAQLLRRRLTGSTDAMDAFTTAGLPTVLFVTPPGCGPARFPQALRRLAGLSRGQSPEWMDRELPAAFASLASLGAPILQYTVCSTFVSSPSLGSIGRAIDLGTRAMPGSWSPMVSGRACAASRFRQPVRRRRRRDRVPARSPSLDVAPSGHADGRSGPAGASGAADPAPDRTDRPGPTGPGPGSGALRLAAWRGPAGGDARRLRCRHPARGRPPGLGKPRRRRIQRIILRPAVRLDRPLARTRPASRADRAAGRPATASPVRAAVRR